MRITSLYLGTILQAWRGMEGARQLHKRSSLLCHCEHIWTAEDQLKSWYNIGGKSLSEKLSDAGFDVVDQGVCIAWSSDLN
jgi:hypothetical protein